MKSKNKFPQSKAKATKKLASIINTKLGGKVSEKEMVNLMVDLRRFVKAAHRITTEPQFRSYYKESSKKGKRVKHKVIETDIKEFKKTLVGKKKVSLTEAFQSLEKTVKKDEK